MRVLKEWPIDGNVILGVLSGIVLPIILTLASRAASISFLSRFFR